MGGPQGGSGCGGVWLWGGSMGAGDILVQLPLLHYHMVLRPEGTSHNEFQKRAQPQTPTSDD